MNKEIKKCLNQIDNLNDCNSELFKCEICQKSQYCKQCIRECNFCSIEGCQDCIKFTNFSEDCCDTCYEDCCKESNKGSEKESEEESEKESKEE